MKKKLLSLLGAAPLRPDYVDAGDFLRVISVAFVGWFHIRQQSWLNPDLHAPFRMYPLVACGYMFVDMMLLLSGFLLMLGWKSGRVKSLRNFYVSRAARILPCYLLCIGVILFAFALPQKQYWTAKHMWTDILSHLSFTHNLFYESYLGTRLNGALWTLAVEVQFYLLFPFLARAFDRKPQLVYCGMVAAGMCARVAVALLFKDTSLYFNRLSAMLDVYANGMLAAHIYHRLASRPQKHWQAWLSSALAIFSAVLIYRIFCAQMNNRSGGEAIRMGQMVYRFPLTALGCVFLVCGSRAIKGLRLIFSNPAIRFLSGLSFNFYMWHFIVLQKLKEWRFPYYLGENPNQAGLQPWQDHYTYTCFGVALLLSLLLTYAVEKPCAKWIKGRFCRKAT